MKTLQDLIRESSDTETDPTAHSRNRISWGERLLDRVAGHPLNRRTVREWDLCLSRPGHSHPIQPAFAARYEAGVARICSALGGSDTVSPGTGSLSDHSIELPDKYSLGGAQRDVTSRLERVLNKIGWETSGYEYAVIPCGSLWLPVVTLSRGDELAVQWATRRPNEAFATRSPLITALMSLRPIWKDEPQCHSLEEHTFGCNVQLFVKDRGGKWYLEIRCAGSPVFTGSTAKRVPVSFT